MKIPSTRKGFILKQMITPDLASAWLHSINSSKNLQRMNETERNTKEMIEPKPHSVGRVRRFFANLGPGLITGAADDDPSGISTYSVR
jgi:hypothetical protein